MSRNSQLVCQYVENISRSMLEEYQDVIRDYVRGRCGVYALYRRGKLYYVGLAGSLLRRLKHHLHDHHANTWDHFSVYLTVGTAHMKEIESVLIRIADPPGNKIKGKFVKAENLLAKLRADYRRRRKEEESALFDGYKRLRATTHIHLDEELCAEAIMVRGKASEIKQLADDLRKQKGVLHANLSASSTGKLLK